MNSLAGKVAIVTGASSGIGRAAAGLFAREGASVVLTARRRDAIDALVAEIEATGGRAVAVAGDVRQEDLARSLVETAVARFGWFISRLRVRRRGSGTCRAVADGHLLA